MASAETRIGVDDAVAEKLVEHIRNQSTDMTASELRIPRDHFVSRERAALEIELLKRTPLAVAHISELPNPGDFITRDIWGSSVIIVHAKGGRIKTYRNMCSHRGGRVEQRSSGKKPIFMCQYHGWSYNAEDGSLRKIGYEDSFGDIDYECSGLKSIKTEIWHGLIFLDFNSGTSQSIDEFIGPEIEAQLAPWKLEHSSIYIDESYTLPVNWKLVVDGALDSLHAQYLHPGPGNVGSRTLTNVAVFEKYGLHGRLFSPRTKLKKMVDSGDIVNASNYIASIMLIFPNTLIAATPDHIEFWSVMPSKNPSESHIRIRFFVRPEIMTPEMEVRVNKSWDILRNAATKEDWPMETWIQENANEWPDGYFRYGRNEVSAQHLHHVLVRQMKAHGLG